MANIVVIQTWFRRLRRLYRQPLFLGKSTIIDRFIFRFFATLNGLGKLLSTQGAKDWFYQHLTNYVLQPLPYEPSHPLLGTQEEKTLFWEYKKQRFLEMAQPCDVILVRGDQRISQIVQTLTHSAFSHSAFYLGDGKIVEADPEGVLVTPIERYIHLDIRICRPTMLNEAGKRIVTRHILEMVKLQPRYDIANIEKLLFKYIYIKFRPDLHVYLGGSTKFETYYICSGIIAHGFHKAGYPIVPTLRFRKNRQRLSTTLESVDDYFQWVTHSKKNYSQIVPADFDNSSFFDTVKFIFMEDVRPLPNRTFRE